MESQTFCFMLTDSDGRKKYGLCHRFLPYGIGARFPVSLVCVFERAPEQRLMDQVFKVAENKVSFGELKSCIPFLQAAQMCDMSTSSPEIVCKVNSQEEYKFFRMPSHDHIVEQMNVENITKNISSRHLVINHVFFCSCTLNCVLRLLYSLICSKNVA